MNWSSKSGDHLTNSMLTREESTVNTLMSLLSSCPQPCFRDFKRPLLPALDGDALWEKDINGDAEPSYHTEKKRRLTLEQVRCLEKSFKVENKLDPDKKMELAQELRLQPRQVAVWFQNRRARWKSKQLEQDYDILKTEYEALLNEKQKLEAEVVSLTDRLVSKNSRSKRVEKDAFNSLAKCESQQNANSDIEASLESENQVDLSSTAIQISNQSAKKTFNCTIKTNIDECSPKSDDYDSDVLDLDSPCNLIQMATLSHDQESVGVLSLNEHEVADRTREILAYLPSTEAVYNNHQTLYDEIAYKLEDGLFYDKEHHYCNLTDEQAVVPAWWYTWP